MIKIVDNSAEIIVWKFVLLRRFLKGSHRTSLSWSVECCGHCADQDMMLVYLAILDIRMRLNLWLNFLNGIVMQRVCNDACVGGSTNIISPVYSLWATFIGLYMANYVVERSTG